MLMKTKETATKKKKIGQWRNEKGNQKISWDKWKCKHNFPKSMGCIKSSSMREVCSDTYLKKQEKSEINKLKYHLR